jgi:hypothetical protein
MLVGVAGLLMILPVKADGVDKLDARIADRGPKKERVKYVPKPIPCGPDAPTGSRYQQEKVLPFFRKQMLDPFKASAEMEQPWAPEVLKVLENVCEAATETSLLGASGAWKTADELVQKGCTYPVIRWMQAIRFQQCHKESQALKALKELDDSLANKPNPWFAKCLVGIGYRTIDPSPENEKLFATRFAEWIANGGLTRDNSRQVFWLLCDLMSDENPTVLAAFEKAPSIDPWLTLMLRGGVARKAACSMRCLCHSDTPLTSEELKAFRDGLAVARKAYEEAWRLNPELPNAATMMIENCGCLGDEDTRLWFDRAVAVEMDRPKPYMSYILFSRPRWGGSVEKLFDFAESCYQTKRHDTRVPLFYVTIMFQIATELKCDLHEVFTRPGVHEKCIEVLEAQANNPKAPKDLRDLAVELLPVVEYVGGDLKKALEYKQLLKRPHSKSVFDLAPNDINHINAVLTGLRFQNGKSLIAAEELYRAGRYNEALAALTVIRDTVKLSSHEQQYLFYRISCLEVQTLLKRGEWIAPTFKHHCAGWLDFNMNWRLEGNGARTDKEMCQLEWMPPLPADVEYEGVFRSVAPTGQASSVCFQLDKFHGNHKPSVNFDYENNTCQVAIGSPFAESDAAPVSIVCEKPEVRFRIVSCKNKVSVWVNDKQLIKEQDISKYMQYFRKNGMRHLTLYGTRVVISDLRMRAPDMTAVKK